MKSFDPSTVDPALQEKWLFDTQLYGNGTLTMGGVVMIDGGIYQPAFVAWLRDALAKVKTEHVKQGQLRAAAPIVNEDGVSEELVVSLCCSRAWSVIEGHLQNADNQQSKPS